MKITPIDKKLRNALCVVVNYNMGYHEFTTEENKQLLRDSIALLDEYASCFDVNGNVSQRGEIPTCWNANTIFESSEEKLKQLSRNNTKQLEFDWDNINKNENTEKVEPLGENNE